MKLYQQLVLFMVAATVLPSAVLGFWLLGQSERELVRRIGKEEEAVADLAAEGARAKIFEAVEALSRAAEAIDWAALSADERKGGLRLLYQQSPLVAAVVAVDLSGAPTSEVVFQAPDPGEHPPYSPEGREPLGQAVPVSTLAAGGKGRAALGDPYLPRSGGPAAVAVAVKLGEGEGALFAVAELGMGAIDRFLRERAGAGRIDLVDRNGRVVASSAPGERLGRQDARLWERVAAASGAGSFFVREAGLLAATVSVEPLGWKAVASVDERVALAPVGRMRRTVLGAAGASLAALLVLGALFTRRMNVRLGSVVRGAEALGRGELATRIAVKGSDELTELANTFNQMGTELETARARLLKWNDELRQRVDEATRDLKEAQAQLVEAQKLAAVGQLGAGVAHEINNPLTGILGNTQLLLLDRPESDADFAALRKIEDAAKRCRRVTENLLKFSQQRKEALLRRIDVNGVLRDALSLTEHQAREEGVTVVLALSPGELFVNADPGHLSQVVLALVSNARTAMRDVAPKELRLESGHDAEQVVFTVRDTGKGIPAEHLPRIFEPFFTTKDVWSNVGLGLSVAYRVVQEHGGKIEVATEVGRGSTFTVRLPSAHAPQEGRS